jgi:hypothetical protein
MLVYTSMQAKLGQRPNSSPQQGTHIGADMLVAGSIQQNLPADSGFMCAAYNLT